MPSGFMVRPDADYTAELVLIAGGETRLLSGPITVRVNRMTTPALEGAEITEVTAFWDELAKTGGKASAAQYALSDIFEDIDTLHKMLDSSGTMPGAFEQKLAELKSEAYELDRALTGDKSKGEVGEYDTHRITSWLRHAQGGVANSTYGPTPAHRTSLANAQQALAPVATAINRMINEDLPALRRELMAEGAPWGRGQTVPQ
tara:strand:+ start:111 stop:719 length:609 start_codon:yes stop_codon:yes gene_type:complete